MLEVGSWAAYPHTPICPRLKAVSRGINSQQLPAAPENVQVESRGCLSGLWHREEMWAGLNWQLLLCQGHSASGRPKLNPGRVTIAQALCR